MFKDKDEQQFLTLRIRHCSKIHRGTAKLKRNRSVSNSAPILCTSTYKALKEADAN